MLLWDRPFTPRDQSHVLRPGPGEYLSIYLYLIQTVHNNKYHIPLASEHLDTRASGPHRKEYHLIRNLEHYHLEYLALH